MITRKFLTFIFSLQIRKIFEPELYPKSPVLEVYDKYFGNANLRKRKGHVCVIGFEPNPHHSEILQNIQKSYTKCGWNTKIFVNTAVSHQHGKTTIFSDNAYENAEWGSSIVLSKGANFPIGTTR